MELEILPWNSLVEETIIVIGHSVQLQWEGISFSVLSWNLLTMSYYLEKEEWKYCSILKLVHYWILHNGLFFVDGPLEVGNPNCLPGEDNSIGRNISNGNRYLESYYLYHPWLDDISWNGIKRLIDFGIQNFSARTMISCEAYMMVFFLLIYTFFWRWEKKRLHIIIYFGSLMVFSLHSH